MINADAAHDELLLPRHIDNAQLPSPQRLVTISATKASVVEAHARRPATRVRSSR
jgi:hypothetical protein